MVYDLELENSAAGGWTNYDGVDVQIKMNDTKIMMVSHLYTEQSGSFDYKLVIGFFNPFTMEVFSNKKYDLGTKAVAKEIYKSTDGNYIIVGEVYYEYSGEKVFAIKVNEFGDILWKNQYKMGDFNGYVNSFQKGASIYILGWTDTEGDSYYKQANMIKLSDNNGSLEERKMFGQSYEDEESTAMDIDSEGNYYLAIRQEGKAGLIKFNSNLDVQWVKFFSSDYSNSSRISNIEIKDGYLHLLGTFKNYDSNKPLFYTKVDLDGNVVSNKGYDILSDIHRVIKVNDQLCVLGSYYDHSSFLFLNNDYDIVSFTGLSADHYTQLGNDIDQLDSNRLIHIRFCGGSYDESFIHTLDLQGNGCTTYGRSFDYFNFTSSLENNYMFVSNTSGSKTQPVISTAGNASKNTVLICNTLLTGVDEDTFSEKMGFVYPNPTRGLLNLSEAKQIHQINIYNLDGTLIREIKEIEKSLDISNLPASSYMFQTILNDKIQTQIIIKE